MNILNVNEVEKIYDGKVPYQALKNINFKVDKEDFVAIMGPSGSGKSTLLNVISTVDAPTSGIVTINGQEPHKMNDEKLAKFRRTELGFIFQDFNLVNTLTVGENIMLPLTLEGISVTKMKQRTKETADFLGIGNILNKRVFEISGGQAQRCAIARAVIHYPSLLLADEPTGKFKISERCYGIIYCLKSTTARNNINGNP